MIIHHPEGCMEHFPLAPPVVLWWRERRRRMRRGLMALHAHVRA